MLLLSSVLLIALLVCSSKLGNYTVFFLKGIATILAVCKISEAAATVAAMSKANMLRVIHG